MPLTDNARTTTLTNNIDDPPPRLRRNPPSFVKIPKDDSKNDPKSLPSSPHPPTTPKPPPTPSKELATTPPPEDPPLVEDIDMETFQQILDLDEDNTHEFSKGMAWAYFTQAEQTFKEMDDALSGKNLVQLSSLGHFLKGSSAALGLSKVQASCEKIQHYGQQRDEATGKNLTEKDALGKIEELLSQVNKEYTAAEVWLKQWYDDHADPVSEQP